MQDDIQRLADKLDRLRCDLSATNSALMALMSALPAAQREAMLQGLAQLSVLKGETVEQLPTPAAQTAARQMLEAEDRLYQALQGAHRLRQSKEQQG